MEPFSSLGQHIEDQWREENYDESLFPSLAATSLAEADIPSGFSAWDVITECLSQQELPRQRDLYAKFGDPPVTVFSGARFHIDIYFWFEGTTAIHQHGFCGAFQVLLGSSIHSWYDFICRQEVNSFMQLGQTSLKVCELLELGAVQQILPGRQYIHSLFHLDHPSATIVVRTDRSALDLPQFAYEKPCLAIDPFFEEPNTTKRLQIVSALYRAGREDADAQVGKLLRTSDLHTSYLMLAQIRHFLRGDQMSRMFNIDAPNSRFEGLLEVVASRHSSAADELRTVFAHQDKLDEILDRRAYLTDPEHRFFMALLLNVEGRERIFELIGQRYPDSKPHDKTLDWLFDLSHTRVMGAGDKANALGIAEFGEYEMYVLEQLLQGKPEDEIGALFEAEHPDADSNAVPTALEQLRASCIISPLLA